NTTKYLDYRCPRCFNGPEDITHLLICIRNNLRLTTLITQVVQETFRKLEIPHLGLDTFIKSFINLHINKKMPLGIITDETLAPFEKNK
ncbi:5653_t:CDS:1, partial [Ambispora leptoticha]